MSIPDELSAGLPPPRAGEPEALRQDIADELADHLLCAARSEHLKARTGAPVSEEAALAAAIERFGEPTAIARRLWWDAMWERIMAQRIFTIMATVATLAILYACFSLASAMRQINILQSTQIASQREAMAAMIAELRSLKQPDGAQWQSLKFRLVDEHSKPASGLVLCRSSGASPMTDSAKADASGLAEFFLPPGQYTVSVLCGDLQLEQSLLLPPKPTERTITCPVEKPNVAPVTFANDSTDTSSIAKAPRPVYFLAQLQLQSRQIGDFTWNVYQESAATRSSKVDWLLDEQGHVLGGMPRQPHLAETLGPNPTLTPVEGLANGQYLLSLVALTPTESSEGTAISTADAAAQSPNIPKLRKYANGKIMQPVVIDSARPDRTVLHITNVFFPPIAEPDPNEAPLDLPDVLPEDPAELPTELPEDPTEPIQEAPSDPNDLPEDLFDKPKQLEL